VRNTEIEATVAEVPAAEAEAKTEG